jgi:hypothetical protein
LQQWPSKKEVHTHISQGCHLRGSTRTACGWYHGH